VSEASGSGLDAISRPVLALRAFSATTMSASPTWAVLAFHVSSHHLMTIGWVPVLYAAAMAAAAVARSASGGVYDRVGLRGLVVLPPLAAVVPFPVLRRPTWSWWPAVVWGAAMGVHESTDAGGRS